MPDLSHAWGAGLEDLKDASPPPATATLQYVARAKNLNGVVASQLAKQARTMSDEDLRQLFQDLLDANRSGGSGGDGEGTAAYEDVPPRNGAQPGGEPGATASWRRDLADFGEEMGLLDGASSAVGTEPEERGATEAKPQAASDVATSPMTAAATTRDSEGATLPTEEEPESSSSVGAGRVLWRFVEEHADVFQLGAALTGGAGLMAALVQLVSNAFPADSAEEERLQEEEPVPGQAAWERERERERRSADGPAFTGGPGFGYEPTAPPTPSGSHGAGAGGVVWSRQDEEEGEDGLSVPGAAAAAGVVWSRQEEQGEVKPRRGEGSAHESPLTNNVE